MDTRTQLTTTADIDGTTYVIDLERYSLNGDWLVTVDRADEGGYSPTRVGNGTWNDDSQRIENMTADLDEDVYNALDLAIADALEG